MVAKLFAYQEDGVAHVQNSAFIYSLMKEGVDKYFGGIIGKTVLDLGAGFSLPQGCLPMTLAVRDGARQCFGIDISNPEHFAVDPLKVNFWRTAKEVLGVSVQGLDQDRVFFGESDTMHDDSVISRIVALQMSASDMWFRDCMFDVMFSNAVFEHVKDAKNVLSEAFRVLKPGGGLYAHWNPYSSFQMGGHDIGIPFMYPWAHLRLDKADHVEKLRQMLNDPELLQTANPPEHQITEGRAEGYKDTPELLFKHMDDDLNKLRVKDFLRAAEEAGFEVAHSGFHINDAHRKYLTPEIRSELSEYSEDELLTIFHSAALKKPY
jgi:SAM-dependent methyltransferase